MSSLKHDAEQLVGRLSDEATWDDLIYAIHVHQKVDRGLAAAEAGQVVSHDEIVRRYTRE